MSTRSRIATRLILAGSLTLGTIPMTAGAISLGGVAGAVGGGVIGGAPLGTGASVVGLASSVPGGILATSLQVAADSNWVANTVTSSIEKVGQAITDGQRKQIEANTRLLTEQTKLLAQIAQNATKARRADEKMHQFGPLGQPMNACGNPDLGAGIGAGDAVAAGIKERLHQSDMEYNASVKRPADSRERLNKLNDEESTAAAVLPDDYAIKDKDAADSFKHTVLNPYPDQKLPEQAKTTAAGKRYTAYKKAADARHSIAEKSMNDALSMDLPIAPLGEWAAQSWREAGHEGDPPGVVDGKISPMALNKMMVSIRSGNPQWYAKLSTENEIALLREIALMQAQRMRMEFQSLTMQQEQTMMQAVRYAAWQKNADAPTLTTLRNGAKSAGIQQ